EGLVLLKGEAQRAAELIALQSVFGRSALGGGGKRAARSQGLGDRKRIACIQGVVAEKAVQAAVQIVGAGFGNDVDGGAAGRAQFSRVVAAVDLEFLHRILAEGEPDPARDRKSVV